ncbi:MAG: cobyric acid synthase [Prochlorococcaceae cyanobacterium]
MVLGTSSGAGKSLMTAALCRVLLRRGECPLPFKGQNMSLNAWVDGDGGEMAYSQAMQAWAAGLEPTCAMNPVLLKPQGDSTSEVILNGRPAGIARAESYYQDWFRPGWQAIRRGLEQLKADHPAGRLVLEGAGSPVEMNLQPRDLTNLRLAQFLRARCLLVADIERGGVFAQLVGTLALLRPVERPLIRGILINRFRGRRELFDSGRHWLEERTGVPVLGVMPWLNDLFPPEDSLDLLERRRHKPGAEIEIAVLRLPSLSNFSDLDPLEAEPGVRLRWVRPGETLGQPDAVLLPGSKRTLADLAHLRQVGLDDDLRRYAGAGGAVFGVCGGLQMLGVELDDPGGFDGAGSGPEPGLGLLPLRTRFTDDKLCRQRRARPLWPPGAAGDLVGFELHRGRSEVLDDRLAPLGDEAGIGWVRGEVAGTYLHGVFDDGPWRRSWLNRLRQRRGLPPLPLTVVGHSVQREAVLERLADAFEAHVRWQDLLAGEGGRGHG